MLDGTEEITELEKISPDRVDAVNGPASGFPILMLKAVAAGPEAAPESTEKAVASVPDAQDQALEPPAQDAPEAPEPEAEATAPAETAKSAAPDPDPGMVNVDIPAGASVSISPADLARLATFKQQLVKDQAAKRDMDPDTGGGTDRDKIPAEDFAGQNRSFPIVKPGDVSDAASSLGRAKGGPGARAAIKAKIIAIARRKGQAFVDELPEAWKDGGSAEKAKAKGGKKKPFPGAAEPFKADKDGDGEPREGKDGNGSTEGPEDDDAGKAEKSGAACKGCGGDMAKDAKFCANCGDAAGDKAEKSAACGCGTAMAKDAKFCGDCGEPAGGRAEKARACKCGCAMSKGQKFCTGCGEKAAKPGKAAKGKIPSPEDAAVAGAIDRAKEAVGDALDAQDKDPDKDSHPADAAVSAHLDEAKHAIGNAEDAQEEDIKTDDPAAHGTAKSAAAGDDGIPYHLARLHDATCAAYRHDDVIIAHPAVAKGIGELVDPQAFAQMTADALADDGGSGSRAREIPALSAAFQYAVTLKSLAAAGSLDEAMEDVRKAFAEYYPDAHPAPGSIGPGEFRRPYVSAGRANQSAKPGQEPRVPLSTHVPEASDFRRPLITAGREAASPGSTPAPSSAAKAGRAYYTNAARDGATQALTSMHDWIADNHPGVCAMTGGTYDGEPGQANSMGSSLTTAKPVPAQFAGTMSTASPVAVSAMAASAAVTPSVTKAERKAAAKAARKAAEMAQAPEATAAEAAPVVPAGPAFDPELLKGMLREVVAEGLGDVIKSVGDLEQRMADYESAPDPAQMAPRSGAGMAKAQDHGQEVPAGGDGFEVERIARLVKRAKDPDSGVRTAAIGELFEMVPREAAVQLLEAAY